MTRTSAAFLLNRYLTVTDPVEKARYEERVLAAMQYCPHGDPPPGAILAPGAVAWTEQYATASPEQVRKILDGGTVRHTHRPPDDDQAAGPVPVR